MSQDIFDSIDPAISGTDLATALNGFKDAIVSGLSGTSRPTELAAGGSWIDTTNAPDSWDYKVWTGSTDVVVFTINLATGLASVELAVDQFIVKKISADTAGAILQLVKNRIANSGQILDGDVVGEIRMVGRTNAAGNPVVGKIIWTASDDQTSSAYGGVLSFYSTPDATTTLTEHMRLIGGMVETIVPHKINSQVLVTQNIATSTTITQMSAAKIAVEMTGSTATSLQGINSAHDSKVVTIHNRSTAAVTLEHLNGGAASIDQIKLPYSEDFIIAPEGSATLYYCTDDTKWKLVSTSEKVSGSTFETFYGTTGTLAVPAAVTSVKVYATKKSRGILTERPGFIDPYGNAYAWGQNTAGQLGVNDTTPRSSPVAVVGGLTFERVYGAIGANASTYGINNQGTPYAWGINTNGQLGISSVTQANSPTAISGGLKFVAMYPRDASAFALTTNLTPYAWGVNTNGQLGDGTVVPKSVPTAVLGGLKFANIVPISGANTNASVLALTQSGTAYAWGINTNGNLGDGSTVAKSSPVAVLGGLTFKQIGGGAVSSRYFFTGLTPAGTAYAWGNNTSSQLGNGDQNARSSPVAVLGGLTFTQLFTHPKSETVMGITSDGTLYAWGDNTNGNLGVGDAVNRSSPVAVLGGLTFHYVKIFRNSVFATTSDGTLYAWGANANGQLALGDVTPRSSPVAVLGGLKFADIAGADGITDNYTIYGITGDGLMYAWGANTNGSIGDGTVVSKSSPVAVLGAFAPEAKDTVSSFDLTVVGGSTYTVLLGPGNGSLGGYSLGRDISKVVVEYIQ